MKKLPHIKKIILSTLIVLVVNELIVHRTKPVGFAIVAAPVAYQVAAAAAAAGVVIGAYIISQTPRDILGVHSRALPSIHDQLQEYFPQKNLPSSQQHVTPRLAIEQTIVEHAFKNNTTRDQAAVDHLQQTIIAPAIERARHITSIPATVPSSPITVSYGPGTVRVDFEHLNTYVSAGFSQGEQLTPLQQHLVAQDQGRAMESAITTYLFEHDPEYRDDLVSRLNNTIKVFYDLNSEDVYKRVPARLSFINLRLEEPYDYMLQKVIDELIPYYFDADGMLTHVSIDHREEPQFIIAKFLKNGIKEDAYKQQLKRFGYREVLDQEEDLLLNIVNTLEYVITGGWLPTNFWYPSDIRHLIQKHWANTNGLTVLKYCSQGKFGKAYHLTTNTKCSLYKDIFDLAYGQYKQQYCDVYGILKQYAHDPLWASKSPDAQLEISHDIETLTKFNTALHFRALQKAAVQKSWGIEDDVPTHVHEALYDTLDLLGTGTPLVAQVINICNQYKHEDRLPLLEAFFSPNGVIKDFLHITGAADYDIPVTIFGPEHAPRLEQLNNLIYLAHTAPDDDYRAAANAALDNLVIAYITKHKREKTEALAACDQIYTALLNGTYNSLVIHKDHSVLRTIRDTAKDYGKAAATYWYAATGAIKTLAHLGNTLFFDEQETQNDPVYTLMPVVIQPADQTHKGGGGGPKKPDDDEEEKKEKKTPKLPKGDWSKADALNYLKALAAAGANTTLEQFGTSIEELEALYETFKDTVGFLVNDSAFQRILHNCLKAPEVAGRLIRGSLYELRVAEQLNKGGEKIIEFGKRIPNSELDIITTTRVIECKNVFWDKVTNLAQYYKQFEIQINYARDVLNKSYWVYSNYPLPEEIKKTFIENGTKYFEG